MEERQATVDGKTYAMPDPFLVIATQNPIEYEGTFALPEAQLDRFMLRLRLGYPKPLEEIVILDEQKLHHPLEELEEVCTVEELREMQLNVRDIYVDQRRRLHRPAGERHPQPSGRLSRRLAARIDRAVPVRPGARRAPRPRLRDPRRRQGLAEPALAHRLIIKTSSSIHDVQPAQIVARAPRDDPDRARARAGIPSPAASEVGPASRAGPRARTPRTSQRPTIDRARGQPMISRLQVLIIGAILVIAAFSTGLPFLFYLVYLGVLVIGGSYVLTRLGLVDLEAGYAVSQLSGHVGDKLRVTYTLRNTSRVPKPWLEIHNPTSLPGGLPGRAISLGSTTERSWLIRTPLTRRGHSGSSRSRSGPAIRSGSSKRRPSWEGRQRRRLSAGRPASAWRLPAAKVEGSHAQPERTLQTTPLATTVRPWARAIRSTASTGDDCAPRRDPGQGVRPGADGRRLDHSRPRRVGAGRRGRRVDGGSRRPGRGVDRRPGAGREPCRRPDVTHRLAQLPADRGGRQHLKVMQLLAAVEGDGVTPLAEALVARDAAAPPGDDGGGRSRRPWIVPGWSARDPGVGGVACVVVSIDVDAYARFARDPGSSDAAGRPIAAPPDRPMASTARRRRALRHALTEFDVAVHTRDAGPGARRAPAA